jgi:hypothetical protein
MSTKRDEDGRAWWVLAIGLLVVAAIPRFFGDRSHERFPAGRSANSAGGAPVDAASGLSDRRGSPPE